MKIIKFDISLYIIILLSLISAQFKNIIILFTIIIIHELGHILWLKIFNKKVISIKIYPFGGITLYEDLLNHNLFKELIISLGGIINQLILIIIFNLLYKYNLISLYTFNIFNNYNYCLILFNLLPIIPLDGSKIFNTMINYFISYYKSITISIILSFITLIFFIIYLFSYKINNYIILGFLIYGIIKYIIDIKYLKNKFILERYLYNLPYKKIEYNELYNANKLKIEKYHFFNHKSEKKILTKIFTDYEAKYNK